MKTVLLLRHAKSSWNHPSLGDFDRPLAPRGRKAAPRIARFMRAEGLIPDVVFCSAALRALETWALVAPGLDADVPLETLRDLYHGTPGQLPRRAPRRAGRGFVRAPGRPQPGESSR